MLASWVSFSDAVAKRKTKSRTLRKAADQTSRRAILTMTRAKKIKTIIEMRTPPKKTKKTLQTQFLKLNISNNKTIFVSKRFAQTTAF